MQEEIAEPWHVSGDVPKRAKEPHHRIMVEIPTRLLNVLRPGTIGPTIRIALEQYILEQYVIEKWTRDTREV